MKTAALIFTSLLLCLSTIDGFANRCVDAVAITPSTTQNVCQGSSAATLTATANRSGSGGAGNFTFYWYSNTSSSYVGGTLIQTTNSTTNTLADTYTPPTASAGTLYYFVIVTNTGPTCTTSFNSPEIVQVNVSNAFPSITSHPSTAGESLCKNAVSTVLSVSASTGGGTISTYQWYSNTANSNSGGTLVATNNTSSTTDTYSPVTSTAGTLYYYCVVSNTSGCTATSNVSGAIVVSNSGGPNITTQPSTATQTYCLNGVATALTVAATGGSGYEWYSSPNSDGSSSTLIAGAIAASYVPLTTSTGTLYYYCSVSNGTCALKSNVSGAINVNPLPTTADAGLDQTDAATCGLTQVTLAGNTPSVGTGAWSIISGTGGSFGDSASPSSAFNGTAGSTYTLRWTISNSPCTASTDDVVVTFNQNPTTASAGSDQTGATTCELTQVTLAANTPTIGTGAWSIMSGTGGSFGNSASPTSTFDGTAGNTYTLRWTITNSPCTASSDDVDVTFNQNPTTGSITGSVSVCPAGVEGYSVTNTAGSSYDWVIIGGTQTAGDNTNSISVTWGGTGSGNVAVTETNAGGCVGTTVNLPVNVQSTAWSGSLDSDWTNAVNWACGMPSSLTDATIAAGAPNYPVVTSNAAVMNITIANGASLSLSNGITLDVFGDWTNDGSFSHNNGKVSFSGSTQKIQGTATATFYHIDVNASASVSIESSQNLAGTLTLSSGSSVDADGPAGTAVFTLLSSNDSPTQDGSIAAIPTGASVSGNVKIQRYMGAEGKYNRYIASPVTGAIVADVISNPPSNSFAIVNNLAQTYTESVAGTSNKGYSNVPTSSGMTLGKGYLIMPTTAYSAVPLRWDVTGAVANGNVNLSPTFNATLDVNNDGWNLVGNPYPSGVIWSWGPGNTTLWSDGTAAAIPTNIDVVAHVPDIANNVFHTWDATSGTGDLPGGIIATGQAFWVHANAASPSLTIHQAAKTSASGEFFRQNTDRLPKGLKVSLNSDVATDNSFILLRNGSTFGYDNGMDATKLYGEAPGVAALNSQQDQLVHAAIPSFEEDIALAINANQNGEYSFSFESIRGLAEFDELYLADLYQNEAVRLNQGAYTFNISSNQATRDGRFFITLHPEKYTSEKTFKLSVYPNPVRSRFKVETNSEGFIELVNNFGQTLWQHQMTLSDGRTVTEIDMSALPTGVYVIRATSLGKSTTKRIIKE
jgi:hypothetical protein